MKNQQTIQKPRAKTRFPVAIGHRGAAGHAPENTLLSIDKALALGADWIEIDVQLARGGVPVVIHNRRLQDSTADAGVVSQQDPQRMRHVDAGRGQHVPTLRELVAHVNRRAVLNIELKAPGSAVATAAVLRGFLKQGWQARDFLISSFDQHELAVMATELPCLRRGLLLGGIPRDYAAAAQAQGMWSIHLQVDFINRDFIADAKARGLRVFVYTVNYEQDAQWLLDNGVDGLFSDYPERIRQVIDSRDAERAA